jgi:hypothetical protein
MDAYHPEIYGFCWADEDAPRFQMEPQGYRGYSRPPGPSHNRQPLNRQGKGLRFRKTEASFSVSA